MSYYTRITGRIGLLGLAGFSSLWIGCVSVPTQEFQAYQESFTQAKAAAEDFILQTKNRAETIAHAPSNPNPPDVRKDQLADRTAALDARLSALELIDQYNRVLVSLAAGTDPEAVAGNIQGFSEGLASFGISKISALVADATPYTAVIAKAVSIIDDLIKKQKFKEAIEEGKPPLTGILQVLVQDAQSIHEIEKQWILLRNDDEREQLVSMKFRFLGLINNFARSGELDRSIAAYTEAVKAIADKQMASNLNVQHTAGASPAVTTDLEILAALTDDMRTHVERVNKNLDEIQAHRVLIKNYEAILKATIRAFENVDSAIRANRQAAMFDFVSHALEFRRSMLAFTNSQLK